jgi:hypothetical protein
MAVAVVVSLAACAPPASPILEDNDTMAAAGDTTVPFRSLLDEELSGIDEPLRRGIREPEEWQALWGRIHEIRNPPPDPPPVDLTRDMIVVVGLGTRTSGGHGVEVREIRRREDGLEVTLVEHTPGRDCPVAAMLTAPVIAVLVPDTSAPVSFVSSTETQECPT